MAFAKSRDSASFVEHLKNFSQHDCQVRDGLGKRAKPVIRLDLDESIAPLTYEAIEVIECLRSVPSSIPSRYFYDVRGAEILHTASAHADCSLSRTETEILKLNLEEISGCIGPDATLVEPGIRSSEKTRTLLSSLDRPKRYIPIDLFDVRLTSFARELEREFPKLDVTPIVADYSEQLPLSGDNFSERRVFFFSDSLLGNFEPRRAEHMLRQFRFRAGLNSGLLLGIDLRKPAEVLLKSYSDPQGLWGQFHLNALSHLNHRFKSDIAVDDFCHQVRYDSTLDRVEMSLRTVRETSFSLGGEQFDLCQGHEIVAEYSHKYELATFADILKRCGWRQRQVWTDTDETFAVVWAEAWAI